jgi:hypothetical protein
VTEEKKMPGRPRSADWRSVACPYCGAAVGDTCISGSGDASTRPHKARLDALAEAPEEETTEAPAEETTATPAEAPAEETTEAPAEDPDREGPELDGPSPAEVRAAERERLAEEGARHAAPRPEEEPEKAPEERPGLLRAAIHWEQSGKAASRKAGQAAADDVAAVCESIGPPPVSDRERSMAARLWGATARTWGIPQIAGGLAFAAAAAWSGWMIARRLAHRSRSPARPPVASPEPEVSPEDGRITL